MRLGNARAGRSAYISKSAAENEPDAAYQRRGDPSIARPTFKTLAAPGPRTPLYSGARLRKDAFQRSARGRPDGAVRRFEVRQRMEWIARELDVGRFDLR